MRRGTIVLIALLVIGVAVVACGVGLIFFFREKLHEKVDENVVLTNGSTSYENWLEPPVPVYMQFRLFHIVNPKEVVANGSRPVVVERGPYVYREIRPKENVTFLDNGTILSYTMPKSFVFEPNMSAGLESDNITTLNFPILTLAYEVDFLPNLVKDMISAYLGAQLFVSHTVEEILWGYSDPILAKLKTKWFVPASIKKQIPDVVGLFTGASANGTSDGLYDIRTGVDDIRTLNSIDSWKGESSLPFWNGSFANMINGTDGTAWHPFIEKTEKLYLFSSDICRSIYAVHQDTMTKKGISLFRYVIPPEVLANETVNPENAAFCTPDCMGTGVLNITVCKGAPVIMSLPHFYQADPAYIHAVGGMRPEQSKHQTQIDVEPITGAALFAAKRLQFNMYVKNLRAFGPTKWMDKVVYPLMWITESAELSDDLAEKFKSQVYEPLRMTQGVQYGVIALGALLVFIALIILLARQLRNKNGPGLSIRADGDCDDTDHIVTT